MSQQNGVGVCPYFLPVVFPPSPVLLASMALLCHLHRVSDPPSARPPTWAPAPFGPAGFPVPRLFHPGLLGWVLGGVRSWSALLLSDKPTPVYPARALDAYHLRLRPPESLQVSKEGNQPTLWALRLASAWCSPASAPPPACLPRTSRRGHPGHPVMAWLSCWRQDGSSLPHEGLPFTPHASLSGSSPRTAASGSGAPGSPTLHPGRWP